MPKNFAFLKPESPFYVLFPNGMAPIKNIVLPRRAVMIGDGEEPQEYYDLDIERLSPEKLDEVISLVAKLQGGLVAFVFGV